MQRVHFGYIVPNSLLALPALKGTGMKHIVAAAKHMHPYARDANHAAYYSVHGIRDEKNPQRYIAHFTDWSGKAHKVTIPWEGQELANGVKGEVQLTPPFGKTVRRIHLNPALNHDTDWIAPMVEDTFELREQSRRLQP